MTYHDENSSSIVFQTKKEHFNYVEAASYLGVSISILKELVRTESVPFAMIGDAVIFSAKNLDSCVDSLTIEPSNSSPATNTTNNSKSLMQPPRYMDYERASAYLMISKRTLSRLVEARNIPYRKISSKVLFDRYDIDNWFEQGKVQPPLYD